MFGSIFIMFYMRRAEGILLVGVAVLPLCNHGDCTDVKMFEVCEESNTRKVYLVDFNILPCVLGSGKGVASGYLMILALLFVSGALK